MAGWVLDRLFLYISADAYQGALYAGRIGAGEQEQADHFGNLTQQLVEYYQALAADPFPYLRKYVRDLVGGIARHVGE